MKNILKQYYCLIVLLGAFPLKAVAQSPPIFEEFVGTVYKIPARKVPLGYGKPVHEYEQIGTVRFKELNIPETNDSIQIPGISMRHGFGIFFKSTMHIAQSGKYGFSLNSDDGSIFWIEDKTIINNDKPHGMTKKSGVSLLEKGSYPVSIWYYQAYPDRHGLIFSSKFLGGDVPPKEKIVLTQKELNFTTGSYEINEKGQKVLSDLAAKIDTTTLYQITIVGHTDNIGSEAANLLLSQNRASAVATQLRLLLQNPAIQLSSLGKGEQLPTYNNDTEEGRQKNRRVEIIFDKLVE